MRKLEKSMSYVLKRVLLGVFAVLVAGAPWVQAASDLRGPVTLVEQATVEMLGAIEAAKSYYDQEPERFYAELDRILDPIVDFNGFSRGVMGYWASRDAYNALTSDAQKQQFKQRIQQFSPRLRSTLVKSYSKGLLTFRVDRTDIQPLSDEMQQRVAQGQSVMLVQAIFGDDPQPHEIRYVLKPDSAGEWKVRNLKVDGVDLGRVYQKQFAAAVRDNDGDVDAVVANWNVSDELPTEE